MTTDAMKAESKTILCVDDEANVLQSLKRMLRKEGYRLVTTQSPEEALNLLKDIRAELVISDQRMPEMEGTAFLQKVKALSPETVRVVLSGYADAHTIVKAINTGEIFRFITKPWNEEEMKVAIKQCLDHYDTQHKSHSLLSEIQSRSQLLSELNGTIAQVFGAQAFGAQAGVPNDLAQNVLNILPIPIVVVAESGALILVNQRAEGKYPSLKGLSLGATAGSVFPEDVVAHLDKLFTGQIAGGTSVHILDNHPVRLKTALLQASSCAPAGDTATVDCGEKTCVIALEDL